MFCTEPSWLLTLMTRDGLSRLEQRQQRLRQQDRAERIGDEGVAQIGGLGVEDRALPGVENGGVVDQDVERLDPLLQFARRPLDARPRRRCRAGGTRP